MKEEWRDIKGYEGKYQVSNLGRVKSLKDRYGNYREKILKPGEYRGYLQVYLCKENKSKPFKVHRLVALHFIDNPNNYPQINHKDENKTNNSVSNLEWCTAKYNSNYGTRVSRIKSHHKYLYGSKHHKARKVLCITTGKEFGCIKEASKYYGMPEQNISVCCKGKRKSAGKGTSKEPLNWKFID